ncbi:hypothetical protein CASFOL_027892 [Castilleja foliolosa]|uniref:Uncharacterized protein n=1 Tax=Castilleja foliolosa TaxID=1961234 RepID=A0ABD3CHR7_9LAMI
MTDDKFISPAAAGNTPAPAVSDAATHVLPSLISSLSIYDKPVNPHFLQPPPDHSSASVKFQNPVAGDSSVIIHIGGEVSAKVLFYHLSNFGVILNFEYRYYGPFQSIGTCKVIYASVESITALKTSPYRIPTRMEVHTSGESCSFNCGS